MKVLISSPRTGSTCFYQHIQDYNLTLPNVKTTGVDEFLNPDLYTHLTLDAKINWLIDEKTRGIEYTFKHHINYLTRNVDYYETWFKDFYKLDEVIVLKRKNTWKWFLSFLFQDFVGWKHAAIVKDDDNDKVLNNIKSNWVDYNYEQSLKQFFEIKSQLDKVKGTIIFYEDLNLPYSDYKKLSNIVDYESFFPNLDIIRSEFLKYD
jgi:hypothetical protein